MRFAATWKEPLEIWGNTFNRQELDENETFPCLYAYVSIQLEDAKTAWLCPKVKKRHVKPPFDTLWPYMQVGSHLGNVHGQLFRCINVSVNGWIWPVDWKKRYVEMASMFLFGYSG